MRPNFFVPSVNLRIIILSGLSKTSDPTYIMFFLFWFTIWKLAFLSRCYGKLHFYFISSPKFTRDDDHFS